MLTFSEDMEIGVAKVDAQHRELIDRINAVSAMNAHFVSLEETKKTLDMLGAYIDKHFGDEEELQRQSHYPKYDWHKAQHQYYENEFKKMDEEFQKNGNSPLFALKLNDSIINWIVKHIKSADVEFGKYYRSL